MSLHWSLTSKLPFHRSLNLCRKLAAVLHNNCCCSHLDGRSEMCKIQHMSVCSVVVYVVNSLSSLIAGQVRLDELFLGFGLLKYFAGRDGSVPYPP